jgi:hypothetical protein
MARVAYQAECSSATALALVFSGDLAQREHPDHLA